MLLNQANLSRFFTGTKTAFRNSFAAQPAAMWDRVATLVNSTSEGEDYSWLGEVDDLREWLGPKVLTHMKGFTYNLTNRKWELSVEVDKHKLEDDVTALYATRAAAMGRSAAIWADQLVFQALQDGTSTNCYDGQFFFDTDHPVGKNTTTTVSNLNTGGGGNGAWYLMDTTRPLKPMIFQQRQAPTFSSVVDMSDAQVWLTGKLWYGVEARGVAGYGLWQAAYSDDRPLTRDNFRADRQAMRGIENDEGRELGINPNLCVVGRANEDAARDLFGVRDRTVTQGATGIASTSNPEFGAVDVMVVPWLP